MAKYVIGAIGLVFLILVGYSLTGPADKKVVEQPIVEPAPFVAATSTYASSTLGFSTIYPNTYRVDENYANDAFGPKKLIHGIKFLIPESMATGTNLLASGTGISLEQLPRAQKCTGDIYLKANVKATAQIINGVNYSVASSTELAGNVHDETVYALVDSKPCTAFRYSIHSTNIAAAASTSVREFDRAKLLSDFDSIRDASRFVQ
ncbi:MAG: hypothetical protein RIQ56_685 [Candidatus Parcubacteria bacterium]|jgi:hypothetical protein